MVKKERKERKISHGVGIELPALVKKSKYDWDKIIPEEGTKLEESPYFFVECDSEEEAINLRSSIQSSGANFYLKRKLSYKPVTRAMEIDGTWGVVALAKKSED